MQLKHDIFTQQSCIAGNLTLLVDSSQEWSRYKVGHSD